MKEGKTCYVLVICEDNVGKEILTITGTPSRDFKKYNNELIVCVLLFSNGGLQNENVKNALIGSLQKLINNKDTELQLLRYINLYHSHRKELKNLFNKDFKKKFGTRIEIDEKFFKFSHSSVDNVYNIAKKIIEHLKKDEKDKVIEIIEEDLLTLEKLKKSNEEKLKELLGILLHKMQQEDSYETRKIVESMLEDKDLVIEFGKIILTTMKENAGKKLEKESQERLKCLFKLSEMLVETMLRNEALLTEFSKAMLTTIKKSADDKLERESREKLICLFKLSGIYTEDNG